MRHLYVSILIAFACIASRVTAFQRLPVARMKQRLQSPLYSTKNNNKEADLDSLRIDESKLSPEERNRLEFIQKINDEADEMVRAAGFNIEDYEQDEVEKAVGDTQWSGQGNAEKVTQSNKSWSDLTSRPGLGLADLAALMTFALIGRSNHNEGFDILSTLGTALPFVLSWALLSPLLGAYTGTATKAKSAILSGILPAWAISVPTGIAIRGALKGYVPPTPFIIVTLVSTLVLLYGSRYVYLSLVGSTNEEERDAGAFEIFKMIGTLVKRW